VDAAVLDAGQVPDASAAPDAAISLDAGMPDSALPPDASVPDAAVEDAAVTPDAAEPPDAAVTPDAAVDFPPAYGAAGTPFPIEGFGEGTLGGFQAGADTYHVTSLADDGAGTLRQGLLTANVPRVVVFDLDGTVQLQSTLLPPSNITIDGRGHQVVLSGRGFSLVGTSHVILVNLTVENVHPNSDDGVQIGNPNAPADHVVLDHLTFRAEGDQGDSSQVDEAISVIFGSHDVTVQWCLFSRWEKVILAGNGDAPESVDGAITVTFHHNHATETGRRHPQARYGRYDFYNNLLVNWHMYNWCFLTPYRESFGAEIQDNGQLRFENNVVSRRDGAYDNVALCLGQDPDPNNVTLCSTGGQLLESGTWTATDSTSTLHFGVGCPSTPVVFARPYQATLLPADASLRALLELHAGATL
jgi:pectate lyase